MADQQNPEEFQRASSDILRNMQDGIPVRKEELEQLKKSAEINQKLNAQLGKATQHVKDLGQAAYDGKQGMSQLTSGVGAFVEIISAGITALTWILPPLRAFKIAATVATVGLSAFNKVVKLTAEQSDALFKTYQDLSKTGQAAAGGMTEVYNNMQKFGYGIKELDQMTALLKENSTALAAFGGTAAEGTKAFADATTQLQRGNLGTTFRMMGKSTDDINRGTAMYIKSQQQLGIQSSTINKNLSDESAKYIMQLDLLSKLTGDSAESLQAKQEEALAEEAYNQTMYELRRKELAGDKEAGRLREEYEKTNKLLTGESQKEFQRGIGGDLSAMKKTMMTANGAVSLIGSTAFTSAKYLDEMGKGSLRTRDGLGVLSKFNATKDILLPAKERAALESRYAGESAENQEEMAKAQQKLQEKGLDPATESMVKAQVAQLKTRDSLQNLVKLGVDPATSALEGFSKVLDKVSGAVPGTKNKEIEKVTDKDKKAPSGGAAPSSGATPSSGAAIVSPGKSVQIGDEVRTGGDPNWRNNNPGNIRYTQFAVSMGAIGENGGFAVFPSEAMGRTAQDALLKGEAYAKLSAADAIRKWAPKNENDSENYIKTVAKLADVSMDKKYVDMSKAEQERFLDAMKKMEGRKVGTVTKAAGSVATTAPAPAPDPALAFEKARSETVEASQKQLNQLTKKSDIGPKKTTVSGNMSMGKPSGPIEYNGQTVKPEDAGYAEASNALVASTKKFDEAKQRSREARTNMAGSRGIGAAPKSSPPPAQTSSAPAQTTSSAPAQTTSAPGQTTSTNDLSGAKPDSSAKLGPNEQGVKPAVLAKKQSLEASLGKKLVVSSGFRPGAKNHGGGDAIDLGFNSNSFTEDEKNKILKSAIDLGFTGIGAEYNAPGGPHIHLDTSHPSLVGWGSDYTSASLEKDSPYAATLVKAKQQGLPLPASPSVASVARPSPDKISAEYGFNGMLSGPTSGYKPDITMHGTENLKITPTGPGKLDAFDGPDAGALMSKQLDKMDQLVQAFNNTSTQDMMIMQLTKLDELVRVMQNQVNVSTKILQQSR